MDAGVVPVKRLAAAKSRLAPAFSDADRSRIALALLEDSLDLCTSVDFLTWWVVSDDRRVLSAATERGLRTLQDPGAGLNAALRLALDAVTAAGAASVTIVPSDLPLAWKGDLQDLLDTGATSDVVVVPSGADGGTNALYVAPPGLIEPRFGPGSLQAHMALAEKASYRCAVLALPRLALDLDTEDDVKALVARPAGEHDGRTVKLLRELQAGRED